MTHAHNCMLRCLNSIVQQAPYIPDVSQPGYNEDDVRDLLLYAECWAKMVEHHHHVEEAVFFPGLEKLTGVSGLMSGPRLQHDEFYGGVVTLREYATECSTRPTAYRWSKMSTIIDDFAPSLSRHLSEEISVLLSLEKYDSESIRRCWAEADRAATRNANGDLLVSTMQMSHSFARP